jgi:hypothetical protein
LPHFLPGQGLELMNEPDPGIKLGIAGELFFQPRHSGAKIVTFTGEVNKRLSLMQARMQRTGWQGEIVVVR